MPEPMRVGAAIFDVTRSAELADNDPMAIRRTESRAARTLLNRLLDRAVDATPELSVRPGGQPYLPGWPDIGISLSHSAGWVAAAVCPTGPVGIDVQRPFPASAGLIRRCCGPFDRAVLDAMPEPLRNYEFARIWSVQEACVKATGQGISGRPWTIPVAIGRRCGQWRGIYWEVRTDRCPHPVAIAQG